ncbi:LIC_10190 family membrane protein [Hymenobacter caeli]|uniref:DUF8201 domain-containing protein n=1 Tax=Hymenobacter caeli TaxID=2735894 RepID=A0ABX2FV67_9BACT|nr:hypothetical protein [Hymenobacter caeli]NRT20364.1 hypothetical protein [Hymenobacter caeli]
MAILVLAGLYALLLPLGLGYWFLRFVRFCLRLTDDGPVAALTTWLGGLALLTVLLEAWSLAGPVHTGAHLAAAGAAATGLWQPATRQLLRRQWARARQLHGAVLALGGLLALVALAVATMPPINIDTGYYHAQSVRWLEEMGVVPGLANLELHIGFNSAWFVPEALFSWGRYVGSPLQVLNTVFFVLFGWYGLVGLDQLFKGRCGPADAVRFVLAAFAVFWLLDDLPSLSPDPAVTLLVFFALAQALALPPPRPGQPLGTGHAAVILLSVLAVTVKLSTLPLLLLALWWVGRSGALLNGRFMGVLSLLAVAIVAPWLARNYVISGYLVFPVTALDFFNPSWKFPLAELRLHQDYIREYARNSDFYNQISVHDKSWQFWLPLWWQQQYRANQVALLAVPLLLPGSLLLGRGQYRRGHLPQAPQVLVAGAVAVGGAAFWFGLAPAFRFGYGFLLALVALLLLPWLWAAARRGARPLAWGLALAAAGVLVASPVLIEYRHYIIAPALNRLEYADILHRLPAPADQAFVRSQFPRAFHNAFWEKKRRPLLERARLVRLLARSGGFRGYSGLDGLTGRSGLLGLPERLVWPAPYPVIAVQAVALAPGNPVWVLQNRADKIPWYAPFPFAARRRQYVARGPRLADGFAARVVPIRNWRREARW